MKKVEFYEFMRKIPKAEVHLHAEGTISRRSVEALVGKKPQDPTQPINIDKLFSYNNLKEFITSFLFIQSLIEHPEDLNVIMDDVASYLKENNIVYCELFFAPSMFLKKGFVFETMMKILQTAIDQIQSRDGTVIRLLIDVSRTFGPENAQANLESTLAHKTPAILGIGLGGDEQKGPARLYGEVFAQAARQGLKRVAHAGEDDGPQSIWDAVTVLDAQRIGHGISAMQDPELVRYLAKRQIPVEICVTSNLFTQKYVSRAEDHPVRQFFDQGVLVCINTDDPTFFNCSLLDEYWTLHTKLNFTMGEIKTLVLNSFKATFLSEAEKKNFLSKVETAWGSGPAD